MKDGKTSDTSAKTGDEIPLDSTQHQENAGQKEKRNDDLQADHQDDRSRQTAPSPEEIETPVLISAIPPENERAAERAQDSTTAPAAHTASDAIPIESRSHQTGEKERKKNSEASKTPVSSPKNARRRALPFVFLLTGCIGAAVFFFFFASGNEEKFPKEWDSRVQDYVHFVEEERGGAFKHPVHVEFLTEKAFIADITDNPNPTEEKREKLDQTVGIMRSLGLLEGDIDLFATTNQLLGSGVIGAYEYADKLIRVRGKKITPLVETTIVHELTHAWQDQHFDISSLREKTDTEEGQTALTALLEGDAQRIEELYIDKLSSSAQLALTTEQEKLQEAVPAIAIPQILLNTSAFPYEFGAFFVSFLEETSGTTAVDDAFTSPPENTLHILAPSRYIEKSSAKKMSPPSLKEDEKKLETGEIGALLLFLLLAERVDYSLASEALNAWNGDAYTTFLKEEKNKNTRVCTRAHFTGKNPRETALIADALQEWAARMPTASNTSAQRSGNTASFSSCDPGPEIEHLLTGSSTMALQTRLFSAMFVRTLSQDFPPQAAECVTDKLLREFSLEELAAPSSETLNDGFVSTVRQWVVECL